MQATVSSFDETTRGGRVVRDDGVELTFTAEALTGTRLRLLRPGQRVRVDLSADEVPRVVRVQILTLA